MDMDSETVAVERADGVARVTMTRPGTHNSFDHAMIGDLEEAVTDLADDSDVRCILLTGEGPAYSTGADLGALSGDASDARRLRRLATSLHSVVRTLARARKPVVAGVNGVVAGGGLGLALAADIVVVHEDARFEFAYPRLGLSGDGGSTYFLPRLVGLRRAQAFVFRDQPVGAREAVDTGLATEIVDGDDFEDRIAEVAAELADGPTLAHGANKRLLRHSLSSDLSGQLAAETDSLARLAATSDFQQGYAAFFSEDAPEFSGE